MLAPAEHQPQIHESTSVVTETFPTRVYSGECIGHVRVGTVRALAIGRRVFSWSFWQSRVSIPNLSRAFLSHLTPALYTQPASWWGTSVILATKFHPAAIHVSTISKISDSLIFNDSCSYLIFPEILIKEVIFFSQKKQKLWLELATLCSRNWEGSKDPVYGLHPIVFFWWDY